MDRSHGLLVALTVALAWAASALAAPTLTVPDRVGIFETFTVQVGGAGEQGDMLRFADAQGEVLGGSYAYVSNAKDGAVSLTAPLEPGEYAVVYLSNREVVASYPLEVVPVQAELSAPARSTINASVEVRFQGPRNQGDYVQFTNAQGEPVKGLYRYVGNAPGDTLSLRAPAQPGDYRIAYYTGRQEIAAVPISVAGVSAELEAPARVPAGAHFSVEWQGPDNAGDLIRVLDGAGKATGSYAYTGNNPQSVTLRAPEEPGDFRVVYLTGGQPIGEAGFTVQPVAAALVAPAEAPGADYFQVAWEGPGNYGDTVQLVDPSSGDDVAYAYVDVKRGDTVSLFAPAQTGDYVLRYVTQGGRVLAEQPLRVTPPPRQPGSLVVEPGPAPRLGPSDAVEVVLDASGSMLQRQDGERRIEIARRTLQQLVQETLPPGTPFALRVFGHREADACRTDLELPLAPLDRAAAGEVIAGVQAMNLAKTPIADSLARTAADLRGVEGERVIVLLTDGEETCEGDPAAAIAALRAAGHDIRVNIIGYAIDDAALEATFARWAELGGGRYFRAAGESELANALTGSVRPAFAVYGAEDQLLARGTAGDEPISLMPGKYTVRVGDTAFDVLVEEGERTSLALD